MVKGSVFVLFEYILASLISVAKRAPNVPGKTADEPPLFYLDSSAFLNGADCPPGRSRTTDSVLAEFRPGGRAWARVERFRAAGLVVEAVDSKSLQKARERARQAGSLGRLSPADLDLVAAALGAPGPAVVVTDDYTIQDLADRVGLRWQAIHTPGIRARLDWTARCTGCGRSFPPDGAGAACPVCGAEVRRKPAPRGRARPG